jgi:hypothetical protein
MSTTDPILEQRQTEFWSQLAQGELRNLDDGPDQQLYNGQNMILEWVRHWYDRLSCVDLVRLLQQELSRRDISECVRRVERYGLLDELIENLQGWYDDGVIVEAVARAAQKSEE